MSLPQHSAFVPISSWNIIHPGDLIIAKKHVHLTKVSIESTGNCLCEYF
jgi:hypothetical protein